MKKAIPRVPLVYPLPIALIGTGTKAKIHYTTVRNLSVMGEDPPLVGIMLDKSRHIFSKLEVGQLISINMPTTMMIDKADLCASVPGDEFDKSSLFESNTMLETPYIEECPVVLIGELIDEVQIKKHQLFVCEIRRTLIDEALFVDKNIPSMNILDPIIYGLDKKYYKIGGVIGKENNEGKMLYRSIRKTMAPKPYSFHFKLKLCQLKDEGKSYKQLAERYNVYHETIEDWYALYTMFGRDGLTKKFANKLASTRFTKEEKRKIAQQIMTNEKTYREACQAYTVSLSRLKNWVKKYRQ